MRGGTLRLTVRCCALPWMAACGGGGPDVSVGPTSAASTGSSESIGATDESSADGAGDGGSSPATSSSETASGPCNGGSCGAPPPPGWLGPIVHARVLAGETPPQCSGDGLVAGPTLVDGFVDPGPASCTCSCELGVPSDGCFALVELGSAPDCGEEPKFAPIAVGEPCVELPIDGMVQIAIEHAGGVGSCERTESDDIPAFAWEATIVSCKLEAPPPDCDGGSCLPPIPSGFGPEWCIYRDDDVPCPDGAYAQRRSYWADVMDTRACTSCVCGLEAEDCSQAALQVYAESECSGAPAAILGDQTCTAAQGASVSVASPTSTTCPVSHAAEPTGDIEPVGPFTFCCQGQ